MTFGNDGARNCLCDPYIQVDALKPEIFTQVVLDIPGKQVCNGITWWQDKHCDKPYKIENYGENYNSSVIGGSGGKGCGKGKGEGKGDGQCLQPFIKSSYLRVALHHRASEDDTWTEYGPSFFFDQYGPYVMRLDSAITAMQVRLVMVCTDSAGPAAFPTSFTGWGYAASPQGRYRDTSRLNGWNTSSAQFKCVKTEADDCNCELSSKDKCRQAKYKRCDDATRTVKVALLSEITHFGWNTTLKTEIKQMLEKSAPPSLLGDTASDYSPGVAAGSFGNAAGINCDAVNNDKHPLGKLLDKHFRGWRTPGDGQYVQEPHEHKAPELITLKSGKKWHVVASKRNKGGDTADERGVFLVEKRLVCFREVKESTNKHMVCCVSKLINSPLKDPALLTIEQNKTRAAILRNF
jgi:hypothetical protein